MTDPESIENALARTEEAHYLKGEFSPNKVRGGAREATEIYGESLIRKFQQEAHTVEEQEEAQEKAMAEFNARVKAGLVDPQLIGADMTQELDVSKEALVTIENLDEVLPKIEAEIDSFVRKEFISLEEASSIKAGVKSFFNAYVTAYPDKSLETIFEVTRDNALKLCYQTKEDKSIFGGSDHGVRHIVEGNLKFARELMYALRRKDSPVSPLESALIHQIIFDHDLGYACGYAAADQDPAMLNDHPLLSTKFIEDNQAYYTEKYGEEGYSIIRNSILYHSYPRSEYRSDQSSPEKPNPKLIRTITSTVDALGVTTETKTPAFFRKPESLKVLVKAKMALESMKQEDGSLPQAMEGKFRDELSAIAEKEPNQKDRGAFHHAIDKLFSPFVVDAALGQLTGVIEHVDLEERDGSLIPIIRMRISSLHALLGNLFGGKLEMKAFAKAMEDFGMKKADLEYLGAEAERRRRQSDGNSEPMHFVSERAEFEILNDLPANDPELEALYPIVESAGFLSIRSEINSILFELKEHPDKKKSKALSTALDSIHNKTNPGEFAQISWLVEDVAKGEIPPEKLRSFLTEREKHFLGI